MTRHDFIPIVIEKLIGMGLTVFASGIEYRTGKPDLVIVYPDKGKYYLTEVVSDTCISASSNRLFSQRADASGREFCRKKYTDTRKACWAAALYCDLGQGLELFEYGQLMGINISKMQRYASMVYPLKIAQEAESFFGENQLQYRSLEIAGQFILTLFAQTDSIKFADMRKFMQFLMSNKKDTSK